MRRNTLRVFTYLTYFAFLAILLIIYKSKMNAKFRGILIDRNRTSSVSKTSMLPKNKLKYILQWTSPKNSPFVYMGTGRKGFIYRNCTYTNCYVTSDKSFFKDYTEFDVIAFAGPEVIVFKKDELPHKRSLHQKYVFANIESAYNYPVCTTNFNGYFNWTWTYKLDSDLRWGYIVIKDATGKIIGPNKIMHWKRRVDMMPVSSELKEDLRGKSKAAAWFASNCDTASDRESYALKLNKILHFKYNLSVDIYGTCGSLICPRTNETACFEKIKRDYYFYLSFENAFSEDYVTEKLLNAVQNNAIPIVYGGANYSRFLPDGSYLNARQLNVEMIAAKMFELIKDFDKYIEYFRWTNHYSYHRMSDSVETDEYCKMCEMLNDQNKVNEVSVLGDFKQWWDPPDALCYGNLVNVLHSFN